MKLDKKLKNNIVGNFLFRINPNILFENISEYFQYDLYKNIYVFHTLKEVWYNHFLFDDLNELYFHL